MYGDLCVDLPPQIYPVSSVIFLNTVKHHFQVIHLSIFEHFASICLASSLLRNCGIRRQMLNFYLSVLINPIMINVYR